MQPQTYKSIFFYLELKLAFFFGGIYSFIKKNNPIKKLTQASSYFKGSKTDGKKAHFHHSDILTQTKILAEQFVGQELIANSDLHKPKQAYFWERDKKGSQAKVDYVIRIDSKILPIEVKAGKTKTLKFLKQFLSEKDLPLGVRISECSLSLERNILSIPFYMIGQLNRIIDQLDGSTPFL